VFAQLTGRGFFVGVETFSRPELQTLSERNDAAASDLVAATKQVK